ncbi:diguanylate cyclase [Guyparkeria halophila]|uniref:diguanylate cyclase n=1 Tax=Guyparkeria halophila TaxID=47960 RepID=A0A6I6D403_9GAMM|nr:sensor domain-containing diguanylate cyclase [Guyparkeria halophila]QGT78081.1 diguanylate cyclase [Guyparkeria halophila]
MSLPADLLPAVLDALPDPLFILSESGRYLAVYGGNDPGYYHDGRTLVGQTVEDLLPADKASQVLDQIRQSLSENRLLKVEYPLAAHEVKGLESADGPREMLWFEGHIQPLAEPVNGERAVVWVARNITPRRDLEEKLRRASVIDPLTGVFNRRKLLEVLAERFGEHRRYGEPCAVVMIDVDHFKRVNDQYGHSVGDEVLIAIAEIGRGMLRENDLLSRFGGEEFVLVLPQTDLDDARQVAERFRRAVIEGLATHFPDIPPVTISQGVAAMREGDTSHEGALHRADQALYEAKRQGRNRIV